MSKKVLKDILDSFDIPDSSVSVKKPNTTNQKMKKSKSAKLKNKDKKSTLDLYKSLRNSHPIQSANLTNLKRKFFKHNKPDKSQLSNNRQAEKAKASVFSDKDFENILPK